MRKALFIAALSAALLLTGCGSTETSEPEAAAAAVETESAEEKAAREAAEAEKKAVEEAEAKAEAERQAAEEKAAKEKAAKEKKAAAEKAKREKAAAKAKINNATEVSARQLSKINKNPDNFTGDVLVVYGKITQFDAATGQCIFRADISNTVMAYEWDYEYNSMFTSGDGLSDCPKLDDVVQDDIVKMTVTSEGSFSYDTQIGGNTTVPMFKVEKIGRI
jgi:flagellar biosynthesis GTPase FlhF